MYPPPPRSIKKSPPCNFLHRKIYFFGNSCVLPLETRHSLDLFDFNLVNKCTLSLITHLTNIQGFARSYFNRVNKFIFHPHSFQFEQEYLHMSTISTTSWFLLAHSPRVLVIRHPLKASFYFLFSTTFPTLPEVFSSPSTCGIIPPRNFSVNLNSS